MKYSDESNGRKLGRIITLRVTQEDYDFLLAISRSKRSNVSRTIRLVVRMIIEIAGVSDQLESHSE